MWRRERVEYVCCSRREHSHTPSILSPLEYVCSSRLFSLSLCCSRVFSKILPSITPVTNLDSLHTCMRKIKTKTEARQRHRVLERVCV